MAKSTSNILCLKLQNYVYTFYTSEIEYKYRYAV